jgi:TrmH family RNA methyltransferase
MISKNKIKHLNSLQLNKYRKIHKEFIAEGSKLVMDILGSELTVKSVYATKQWINEHSYLLNNTESIEATREELKKISSLSTASDVFAVVGIPDISFSPENINSGHCLMLDGIRDPGNLGTIIRTADWFGITNIICSKDSVDAYNPKVVQSSMGSIARVRVYYEELAEVLRETADETMVYGTFMDGVNISEMSFEKKGIIIIGSEAHGISDALLPFINARIGIPSSASSKAESLNAAIATAIVCYEIQGFRKS